MFVFRHALGWGLLFLAITPTFAQSVNDLELQPCLFQDVEVASFNNVWQEPSSGIASQVSVVMVQPIEQVSAQETTPSVKEIETTTPTAPPLAKLPQLLSSTDTIRATETGLFEWFFGMLGVVGFVAIGGVYWIFHVRPALEVRHTSGRIRLSSTLPLPRRSGLFLIEIEDQTVLMAMDGGGIRQVVPLDLGRSVKKSGRRSTGGNVQLASPSSTSEGVEALNEVTFQDVYQERRTWEGDLGPALSVSPSATTLQSRAADSCHVP